MSKISAEIGNKIRQFRQGRKMTLDELALAIHKSRSTLSKYERGDISVDIDTLYELANALGIRTEQLLYTPTSEKVPLQREVTPAFFQNLTRFYCYYFDGRNGKLIRSAFDVFSRTGVNQCKIAMYMNFKDLTHYQQAENTYWGYMEREYEFFSVKSRCKVPNGSPVIYTKSQEAYYYGNKKKESRP